MLRIALVYGTISGAIIISIMTYLIHAADGEGHGGSSMLVGYLIMLIALSCIFIGIKRYRDKERGGIIKFLPAFGLGLAIALVASVIYIIGWEAYLAATGNAFIDNYIAANIDAKREAGLSGAEMEAFMAEMDKMRVAYGNPVFRVPITFTEIFPVGFLIALISAAILRNPKVLPARESRKRKVSAG